MVKILADDWHVLTGGYVLDALPEPERAGIRASPAALPVVRGGGPRPARPRSGSRWREALSRRWVWQQRVLAAAYRTRQLRRCRVTGSARPVSTAGRGGAAVRPSADRRLRRRRQRGCGRCPRHHAGIHPAPARVDPGEQRRDHPGGHGSRRPDRVHPDVGGRKRHRSRLRRPAGSRRHRYRDSAGRAGVPGVGDEPVRRPFGGPDGRPQHRAGLARWCPETGSG